MLATSASAGGGLIAGAKRTMRRADPPSAAAGRAVVVIPTLDRFGRLLETLAALDAQDVRPAAGRARRGRQRPEGATAARCERPRGPAAAARCCASPRRAPPPPATRASAAAAAPVVLFLGDDMRPAADDLLAAPHRAARRRPAPGGRGARPRRLAARQAGHPVHALARARRAPVRLRHARAGPDPGRAQLLHLARVGEGRRARRGRRLRRALPVRGGGGRRDRATAAGRRPRARLPPRAARPPRPSLRADRLRRARGTRGRLGAADARAARGHPRAAARAALVVAAAPGGRSRCWRRSRRARCAPRCASACGPRWRWRATPVAGRPACAARTDNISPEVSRRRARRRSAARPGRPASAGWRA